MFPVVNQSERLTHWFGRENASIEFCNFRLHNREKEDPFGLVRIFSSTYYFKSKNNISEKLKKTQVFTITKLFNTYVQI